LQIVTTMNRGGLETMLMNYYRNIDRSKIQFDFLEHRSEESDYDKEIISLGGRIYRIDVLNPFSFKYRQQLRQFFKNHPEYKIVHCHLDCMSSIPLSYAKKNAVKVRIAHSHSSSQDKNIKFLLKSFYKRRISKVATHLFACGDKAGKWMFGNNDFSVINNAINTKDFLFNQHVRKKVREELELQNKFVIGHVGRFNEPKNHTFIINIFKELVSINDNAKLLLVGEGNLKNEIEKKVEDLGLSQYIVFYGKCDCVNRIMQAFDIFLFPSLYEGLPVTMVEAQANGLKCFISNKVPKECIMSENVEILSLEDTAVKWAESINKYSEGYTRKNMLKSISDNGFDIEKNTKELEGVYFNEYKKSK
ncbi:MAG: glycosyltransferase family 1 protein, partial [Thomasclavelia spiroformis]